MRSLFLILCFSISLFAGDAVKIGTSLHSEATAFNNSRKIARTSDDKLVVVYQDIVDSTNVIKMTKSADGINWTEPKTLANGYNPAIAVSEQDIFYIAWEDPKQKDDYGYEENGYVFDFNHELGDAYTYFAYDCKLTTNEFLYPSLEATKDFIIVAYIWNGRPFFKFFQIDKDEIENGKIDDIYDYEQYICGDSTKCCRIALAGDLEYKGNNSVAAIWAQEINGSNDLYCLHIENIENIYECRNAYSYLFTEWPSEDGWPLYYQKIPNTENCKNPSLSTRSFYHEYLRILAAWDTPTGIKIFSGYPNYYDWWEDSNAMQLSDSSASFPMTDDIAPFQFNSTAIIWQNKGYLNYAQTGDHYNIDSVVVFKELGEIFYPNICYKTYRWDVFDLVWMRPNGDGYDIMYKRFEKDYLLAFKKCEIYSTDLPDAYVGEEYSYNISANMSFNSWLLDGELPENCYIGGSEISIWPCPVKAGVYDFTIALGPYFQDFIPSLCDTAHFTLTIHESRTDVETQLTPKEFALQPNYPNPFNPSTQIQYDLPQATHVDISIYNLNGKFVENLVQEKQTAGSHKIIWQADDMPSGTYFIRMQAGEFEQTRICLLIK